jgi:dTDP-4-dehydrorhamnose reductase
MKILLFGRNGQLGARLTDALAPLGAVQALGRGDVDLTDPTSIERRIRDTSPDVIVNAAAYTAVDQAESDEATAMCVNGTAPAVMAQCARERGALLVHYSTDYVFDGKAHAPYREGDATAPLGVYGRSKLAGEEAIRHSGAPYLILRTAWLYANRGKNFLNTMLRVAGEGKPLRVVNDQRGSPTYADSVAAATADVLSVWREAGAQRASLSGVYHVTCGGEATWFEFAQRIFELAGLASVAVSPISSRDYLTPARRPGYSVLSNDKLARVFGVRLPHWEEALRRCLAQRRRQQ